jgi:hypothetical protein
MKRYGRSAGVALTIAIGMELAGADFAHAQQPILQVRLNGVGATLVQARLSGDGTLELPLAPLEELTGEELGDAEYVSLPALGVLLGPAVELDYDPRRALLSILDTLGGLAATQTLFARREAESRTRPGEFRIGGPFGSLTTDLEGARLIEGGWNVGRFVVGGAHSTESGTRWSASARLLDQAYLTYDGGERRDPRFGMRWAGGPTFVQGSYSADDGLQAQVASTLGPWAVFLRDDGSAALTYRAGVQVTVGRTPDGAVTRISFGRNPSPFTVPRVF